jgi:hypothetical protein
MGGGGGGGSKSTTIGYKYFLGLHVALCHGLDEVRAIRVGEREAWKGSCYGGRIDINQPELFGGEKREGGIVGAVDVLMGGPSQGQNDYLVRNLGSLVPAFRGVVSLVMRQMYLASMNPYIKPWSMLVRRTSCDWYPTRCAIGLDRNPAHIIYECLTNTEWGLGYPPQTIDDASFRAVADQLYAEDFGLSTTWSSQDPMEDFIGDINRHIDAVLYTHPRTGLWMLRLMRGDYDPATVPVFGPAEISELRSFARLGYAERVNQLVVKFSEVTDVGPVERCITIRNPAARAAQGQTVAETVEYPAITRSSVASKVATRDLRQRSAVLAKATIVGKRHLTDLLPGDVFKLHWPEYGLDAIYMRAVTIDYGTPTDRKVTVEAIEDVYALAASVITSATPTGWENPVSIPQAAALRRLTEIPYYVLVKAITGDIPAIQDAYDPKAGVVALLAAKPTPDAMSYNLVAQEGSEYVSRGSGDWTPTGTLRANIGPQTTEFMLDTELDTHLVHIGCIAYLGDELVMVKALINGGLVTVARGVLDTVPQGHPAGTRLWFCGVDGLDDTGYDGTEYLEGETVKVKALTRTARGELFEAAAPLDTVTLRARAFRPYPPGNVRLNGAYFPDVITGPLTVSWAHRDRKQQTGGTLVEQGAADIGPEAGTTYTVRVYGEGGVLRRTVTGLTGTSWTWDTETADCALGRLNTSLRIEVESVRDGYTSWTTWSVSTTRA